MSRKSSSFCSLSLMPLLPPICNACLLHGAAFEEHLEALTDAECSCRGCKLLFGTCNTTTLWAALVASLFPCEIQGAGCCF